MSMVALVFAFLAFCIVFVPEKVTSGIDDLFWDIGKTAIIIFWVVALLSDGREVLKSCFLTTSVVIFLVGIMTEQLAISQAPLFLYVLAVTLLIYENDIIMFIRKYNEYKELPNGIFADLIIISLITFIIVFAILNLAITLSVIIIMILSVMTWDLV